MRITDREVISKDVGCFEEQKNPGFGIGTTLKSSSPAIMISTGDRTDKIRSLSEQDANVVVCGAMESTHEDTSSSEDLCLSTCSGLNEYEGELNSHPDTMMHLPHAIDDSAERKCNTEGTSVAETQLKNSSMTRRSSKRANSATTDDSSKIRSKLNYEFLKMKNEIRDQCEALHQLSPSPPAAVAAFVKQKLRFSHLAKQGLYLTHHPCLKLFSQCKQVSNDEFIDLFLSYLSTEIPSVEVMFPWLHGLHPNNYGQMSFFSTKQNDTSKPKIIPFSKPQSLEENSEHQENIKLFDTPSVRFMMPIRSSNLNGELSLNFNDIISESTGLIRGSVSSNDILMPLFHVTKLEIYLNSTLPNFIFNYFPLETIINDCKITQLLPEFHNLDPKNGINLRNFHIQVSKLSHLSDFFVYCFNFDHEFCIQSNDERLNFNRKCKCVQLSRLLHIAQIVYQYNHPELIKDKIDTDLLNSKNYNTFMITNPNEFDLNKSNLISIENLNLTSSQKNDFELCSIYDIHVFQNWDSNYLYRERLEISKMSSATPLKNHIWFGNITDFECLQIKINSNQFVSNFNDDDLKTILLKNKSMPNYCDFSNNSVLKLTKNDFKHKNRLEIDSLLINCPKANWKLTIFCNEKAKIPTLNELLSIFDTLKDSNSDSINLEFPVSGSLSLVDLSNDNILSIINICKLCYYKCDSQFPGLFYCSDGYTETSLFGLLYLIFSENLCVDEAILRLHKDYARPFFIFKSDYSLLIKLEPILIKFSPLNNLNESIDNLKFENDRSMIRTLLLTPRSSPRSRSNSVGSNNSFNQNSNSFITPTGHHVIQLRGFQNSINSNNTASNVNNNNNQQQQQQPRMFGSSSRPLFTSQGSFNNNNVINKPVIKKMCDIEIDGSFDDINGSLPSLILPHLYLGSIEHASSIPMLERLNIKYIVSVGERIPWANELKKQKFETSSGCEVIEIENGQGIVGCPYEINVKKIMRVQNINDDGIGTLTNTINDVLEFIEECYQLGSKVLVHCQVGVSRSATVCIAEVMKRLNITLARAYMFVRVRRLNVIIQPNLKLMYELFKWEEIFIKDKYAKSETVKRIKANNVETSNNSFNGTPKGEDEDIELKDFEINSEIISNVSYPILREVDWYVMCREIYNLNKNYIR